MFVYGVRCSLAAVAPLTSITADYYMDYGILVFPTYTRSTTINAYGSLTPEFWKRVATVVGNSCRELDVLEHPYISDDEATALVTIRKSVPDALTSWYYLPTVVPPTLIVSDM